MTKVIALFLICNAIFSIIQKISYFQALVKIHRLLPTFSPTPAQFRSALASYPLVYGFTLFTGLFALLLWTHILDLNPGARLAFFYYPTYSVPATVLNEAPTGEVALRDEIRTDIYAVYFSFTPRDSTEAQIGVSYNLKGRVIPVNTEGSAHYPEGFPHYATFGDTEPGPTNPTYIMLVPLFLLFGAIWLYMIPYQARHYRRWVGLPMQQAKIVGGKNTFPIEGAIIQYTAPDGDWYEYEVPAGYTQDLPDAYWIIVDPELPSHPAFPSSKPWPFRVDEQGNIRVVQKRLLPVYAVAALLLITHSLFALNYYFG